jgi:hypothetical protein
MSAALISSTFLSELEIAILLDVVTTFSNLRERAARYLLMIKFEGKPAGQAISNLVGRNLIRNQAINKPTVEEEYLPTAAGFEFCGNAELRDRAKLATSLVLHIVKQMFKGERKKEGLSLADLQRHYDYMYPNRAFDAAELKLGLYLAGDFGVLSSYQTTDDGMDVTSFQISELAIGIANPDAEWDAMMARYKPSTPSVSLHLPPAQGRSVKKRASQQTFLPAGSQHAAYVQMRKIIRGAKTEILVVDNYVDHTLWELLTNVRSKAKGRILTDHMKGDFRLEGRKFVA